MHNILHTTYNVKSWSLNNICTCKKYQKGKFNKSTKQLITTKCETISNSFWDFNLFCIIIKTTIQVYDFKTTNIAKANVHATYRLYLTGVVQETCDSSYKPAIHYVINR